MRSAILKRTTTVATFVLLLGLGLPANSQAQSAFDIGIRGGVTQATFYGDDVASNDFRPGFTGGVFLTYHVNKAFSIQPEVLYSLRGAKNHFSATTSPSLEDVRVSQDVIEIPVLFKLSAPLSPITPRIYAGPSLGFITNTSVNGEDADDAFNDVDFGGILGGEIAYQVKAGPLSEVALDGRYNLGFVNLGDVGDFEDVRNSSFTGTMSIRFNI
jgi:hypothetical protein